MSYKGFVKEKKKIESGKIQYRGCVNAKQYDSKSHYPTKNSIRPLDIEHYDM